MNTSKLESEIKAGKPLKSDRKVWFMVAAALICPPVAFLALKRFKLSVISFLTIVLSLIVVNVYASLGNWPFPNWLFPVQVAVHIASAFYVHKLVLEEWISFDFKKFLLVWSLIFSPIVVVYIIVNNIVLSQYAIASVSMSPELIHGDIVVVQNSVEKQSNQWFNPLLASDYGYGDLVVFQHPAKDEVNVKRIVARAGDKVEFVANSLKINGDEVEREKIDSSPKRQSFNWLKSDAYYESNHGKRYIVNISEDSVAAKGSFTIPDGFLFVMGDNRNQSLDSRFWGLLPKENVLGKPIAIWWSIEPGIKPWIRWNRVFSWIS